MSENSLSETYGMVYFIRPGDTPEYLEDLRKRGFITVSINIDEAVEKEYANIVVTAADTTDPNNWADGPAKQVTFIDSMTDTTNCSVTINNSNSTDTTVDPGSLDGPNPIGGGHHQYHFVQYGETQEYLESLVKEGYMMVYHEDNPPEEGKLTISKPNPEFHPMTDISATTQETLTDTTETEYIYGPYKPLQLTVEELIAALGPEKYEAFMNTTITATRQESRTAYTLVPVAEGEDSTIPGYKLVLVDLTEEEIAVFNELPHGDISFSLLTDEQKALILKAVQSYNNSLDEKETITADTTGADPAGLIAGMKSYLEEIAPKMSDIDSLTDEEVASFNETLKSFKDALRQAGVATYLADTTLDPRTDTGMNPETFDPRTDTSLNDLLDSYIAALDEKEAKTADTTGTTEIPADVAAEIDALPKGLVDLNKEYIAARDELIAKTGKEPNSAEVFSYMVEQAKSGKNQSETTVVTSEIPADVAAEIDALPKGLVDLNKEYIAARDELIAKTGKEPNSAEVFSYMVEQAKSGKKQSETTVSPDTTVNDTTDRTITLPGGLIVKLSDVLQVTDSLSDDTNTYFYRVSDYINPETGRLEDIPIPLYVFKNSEQIAFISTVDAETEAVTSVQVACADTDGWRTIGTLNNPDGIDWKYQAGNLTGSGTASVVWHAQELGALGVWTDGTDNWTGIAGWFDANWTMLGCGDFDGDGKDSVLMSLSGGQFYSVDLDGTLTALGGLNWSGWEFGAVGDFAGDGKDDVVLFNKGLNCVVLLADGNADAWTSLGTIDSSDWAIAGAGDFNSDGIDDLLVRQDSTGLIGGYAGADMSKWSVVDSDAGYYLA